METQQKTGWGGKRDGAGKKSLYQEPTANMTFRVPISHRDEVRRLIRQYLETLKTQPIPKKQEPEYGC